MRLPHRATLLRPGKTTDAYGDEVEGPLAPVGEPFPAWRQQTSSTEAVGGGGVLVTASVLFFGDVPFLIEEDDVVEVEGIRYTVDGEPYYPVNPRGRRRYNRLSLKRVTRGGP